jgi:Tfp pilus assembly protein PilF
MLGVFGRASKAIQRFIYWLGPARAWTLFALLAFTGLVSLILNAVQPRTQTITLVQSLLAIAFLIGAVVVVVTRFTGQERTQIGLLIGPAAGALAIGVLFPQIFPAAAAIGAGWLVIAPITARSRIRREYQAAIKAMRKNDYNTAIKVMNDLIKAEPKQADHYRFRAEVYRLAGKPKRAKTDFEKVVSLTPESGVGYNALAELHLQTGEYDEALNFGQKALELEPRHWVAAYNLGMIEDRMGRWADAIEHLRRALDAGMSDSRHRLLAYLWIARAQVALGKIDEAQTALEGMKREKRGMREWKTIFESDQADVLRDVLLADVELAEKLVEDMVDLDALEITTNA